MIDIRMTISRNRLQLTANGHAGYARAGEDIVCAAASALVHTLLLSLSTQMSADTMLYFDEPGSPGTRSIDCGPSDGDWPRAEAIFRTIACGLDALGCKYPDNVRFGLTET